VTGLHYSAAQVQAITWVAYRRIHKNLVWRIVTGASPAMPPML
jgi:hypothetical protein